MLRAPKHFLLFSVLVGTGFQLLIASLFLGILAYLFGYAGLGVAPLMIGFMSVFNGYSGSFFYVLFKGDRWVL